jgi:maltose O-acetyltransferase
MLLKAVPRTHKAGLRLTTANFFIRSAGINAVKPVYVDNGFKVLNPRNITVGYNVSLGHNNQIWAYNKVTIGPYTLTAKDLLIVAGSHEVDNLMPRGDQRVEIGAGCWIGARVTILGGVTIGKGVIIGACSVINKDVPDFAIVAGNPAKVIRYRKPEQMQWNPFRNYSPDEI